MQRKDSAGRFRKKPLALAVRAATEQLLDEAHRRAWVEERRRESLESGIRLTEKAL